MYTHMHTRIHTHSKDDPPCNNSYWKGNRNDKNLKEIRVEMIPDVPVGVWFQVYLSASKVVFPFGQRTRRGWCPIEHRGEFMSVRTSERTNKWKSVPGQSPPRTWNPHPKGPEPLHPFLWGTRIYFPTQTDRRKFSPVFYRTSSRLGPLPSINFTILKFMQGSGQPTDRQATVHLLIVPHCRD